MMAGRKRNRKSIEECPSQPKITNFFSLSGGNNSGSLENNASSTVAPCTQRSRRKNSRFLRTRQQSTELPPIITIVSSDEDENERAPLPSEWSGNCSPQANTSLSNSNNDLTMVEVVYPEFSASTDKDVKFPTKCLKSINAIDTPNFSLDNPEDYSVDGGFKDKGCNGSATAKTTNDNVNINPQANKESQEKVESLQEKLAYAETQQLEETQLIFLPDKEDVFPVARRSVSRKLDFDEEQGASIVTIHSQSSDTSEDQNTHNTQTGFRATSLEADNPNILEDSSGPSASAFIDYTVPKHIFEDSRSSSTTNDDTENFTPSPSVNKVRVNINTNSTPDSSSSFLSNVESLEEVLTTMTPVTAATKTKTRSRYSSPQSKSPLNSRSASLFRKLNRSKSSPRKNSPRQQLFQSPGRNSHSGSIGGSSTNSPSSSMNTPSKLGRNEPYYLRNFCTVVETVMCDSHHEHLFDEDDRQLYTKFNSLSMGARKLYVRLFQRKWCWKVRDGIKYNEIASDLTPLFNELHNEGFLCKIEDEEVELPELLGLLNGEQAIMLANKMNLSLTKRSKQNIISQLIKSIKTQKTLSGSRDKIIAKAALSLIGHACKVSEASRAFFIRLFILYSPPQYWDDEEGQTSNQLLQVLLTNKGDMSYPDYEIKKLRRIYPSKSDLLRFHMAWTLHSDMMAAVQEKHWSVVIAFALKAIEELKKVFNDVSIIRFDESLPTFLRAYTAGSVLARTAWLGVDGFQKEKKYKEANEVLYFLLNQKTYLVHYRGKYYERLIVNSKQHLKQTLSEVRDIIIEALKDEYVHNAHKYSFSTRFSKIKQSEELAAKRLQLKKRRSRKKAKLDECEESSDDNESNSNNKSASPVCDNDNLLVTLKHAIPEKNIVGEKMNFGEQAKGKSVFLGSNTTGASNSASSVELFAISHYITNEGYTHGVHGEGSVPVSMFGILFWDVIYSTAVDDAFHTPYQAVPLDLAHEDFYKNRKDALDQMLNMIKTQPIQETLDFAQNIWINNVDKTSIVNWSLFSSFSQFRELLKSMGRNAIAAICERLTRSFRYSRAGFPDLVVWNDNKFKFVEVKGPGDSLSAKQYMWIEFLLEHGIPVEVCYVKSVSNKRIRPIQTGECE